MDYQSGDLDILTYEVQIMNENSLWSGEWIIAGCYSQFAADICDASSTLPVAQ